MASNLYENAISSIELGVEDYRSDDARRPTSSVRNMFAGVLLLLKEVLYRSSPELIYQKLKPVQSGSVIKWEAESTKTVDVQGIKDRWKSLGWAFDWKRLDDLRNIRNKIEHRSTSQSREAIRQALSDTFALVVVILQDHLDEIPVNVFSNETWETMLEEAKTHRLLGSV